MICFVILDLKSQKKKQKKDFYFLFVIILYDVLFVLSKYDILVFVDLLRNFIVICDSNGKSSKDIKSNHNRLYVVKL